MSRDAAAPQTQTDVRAQAASRLSGGPGGQRNAIYSPDALAVLYQLASSPTTADDALALLHELQVHQVELDLQAEELRDSRTELETALRRQIELYDWQPIGSFTVNRDGMLQELNLTGATMLGIDRDKGPGRLLEEFVDPGSRSVLRSLMADLDDVHAIASATLQIASAMDAVRTVGIHVRREPSGASFLVVLAPVVPSSDRGSPAVASR